MNIWDENKLVLFIAFVVPGFIAIKVYELLFPSMRTESSKQIIDAISYSCLNYGIWLAPILYIESTNLSSETPYFYVIFYLVVLFFSPVLLVILWKWVRETEWVQALAPHPTQKPWDYVFSQRKTYWVIVTLKDGSKVAGMYGENSFASSAPSDESIFLEEHWLLNEDGGFERQASQTSGVIVLASEILFIELIHSGGKKNE